MQTVDGETNVMDHAHAILPDCNVLVGVAYAGKKNGTKESKKRDQTADVDTVFKCLSWA